MSNKTGILNWLFDLMRNTYSDINVLKDALRDKQIEVSKLEDERIQYEKDSPEGIELNNKINALNDEMAKFIADIDIKNANLPKIEAAIRNQTDLVNNMLSNLTYNDQDLAENTESFNFDDVIFAINDIKDVDHV